MCSHGKPLTQDDHAIRGRGEDRSMRSANAFAMGFLEGQGHLTRARLPSFGLYTRDKVRGSRGREGGGK